MSPSHGYKSAAENALEQSTRVDTETGMLYAAQAQAWATLAMVERLDMLDDHLSKMRLIEDHLEWVKSCLQSIDQTLGTR